MRELEITIVLKQKLETLPPVIYLIDYLIDHNIRVNLICTDVDPLNIKRLAGKIDFHIIKLPDYRIRYFKVFSILKFRKLAYQYLEEKGAGKSTNSCVWIASAEAAMALGHRIAHYKYVFQCHELYDQVWHYRLQNKFYFRHAKVAVCPESNRASILRYWYQLRKTPAVLVNSPYHHPRKRNMLIEDENAAKVINNIKHKKIILYMGVISKTRDITPFAEAIAGHAQTYHLLLLGNSLNDDGYLEKVLQTFKHVSHIKSMPSPMHLQVASWAHTGILSYGFTSLNNLFCAPNKIWEYAGFGIPMISNDIPGVAQLLSVYGAGLSANLDVVSKQDMLSLILKIDQTYEQFKLHAEKLYQENDYNKQLADIIKEISA